MALSLSHRRGTWSQWTPYSFKVGLIHSNWVQALAAATYSASAVERDIHFCFLEDQHTKVLQRNWQASDVDFLSSLSPAQSESVYPQRANVDPRGYQRP